MAPLCGRAGRLTAQNGGFGRGQIECLKLSTAAEVVECYLTSSRCCEDDIPLALGFLDAWSQHVVLREFVTIPTQYEMRAFVYDRRLTALCQYCPSPARAFTHPSRFP